MNGWTIHAKATGHPGGVDPDALDELMDLLVHRGGSVAGDQDGSTYSATFSVDDPLDPENVIGAANLGLEIFTAIAEKAGLPDWPITRLEVLTWDQHDADIAAPLIPELLGVSEVAELFTVSRQRVSELRHRSGFPAPVADLKSGPVWIRPSLNHFLDTWARRPGRPPKVHPADEQH